jgi:alcohol dehydrogenase (cytochrome c)
MTDSNTLALSFNLVLLTFSVSYAQQPAPLPGTLRDYQPVTAERLKNPEDGNWLMNRRTYDGWGYSPLKQITPANVARLRPVWVFSTNDGKPHESAPLVNNGVMFVTSPANQVIAIDVKTGNLLWRYKQSRPAGSSNVIFNDTNRGVALYEDKVFYALPEAVLVALDAKTGKELWRSTIADYKTGYYVTLAPLVADGKVMVGASGGESGIRGFIAAFSADTGKELWRTFTIPAPGEPGSETWPKGGDQWKHGGTPVWVTGNYDPETNLAYWGTGNPGPYIGDQRTGDDLYSCSTLAIDVATGKIKGYFQYNPNDSWDWDEVSPPLLVDYRRDGQTVKGLIDVARDGYIWYLERTAQGPLRFHEAHPFVKQNVFSIIDPKTGHADVDRNHKPETGKMADFCPGWWGGKNWIPISFSPLTRMIYVPANENVCGAGIGTEVTYTPGKAFEGAKFQFLVTPGADHIGEVQAWNIDTGKRVWTHTYARSSNWGGMLATAGGLVFNGGTGDRKIHAFDARTGKLLWEFPTNSGIIAPPTTFLVDGKQYLAVYSGYGGDAAGMQGGLNRAMPGEFPEVPQGGAVWVFALE